MRSELEQFFIEKLGLKPENLNSETRLNEDLGLDSIDMFDLVIMLNSKINKTLTLRDFQGVSTFGELAERVNKLR